MSRDIRNETNSNQAVLSKQAFFESILILLVNIQVCQRAPCF